MEAFGRELSEKDVIRSDGSQIGGMHNVTVDPASGKLKDLHVEPLQEQISNPSFPMTPDGYYRISASRVTAVDDCVVVE